MGWHLSPCGRRRPGRRRDELRGGGWAEKSREGPGAPGRSRGDGPVGAQQFLGRKASEEAAARGVCGVGAG